jgi:glycosyltransferase involved in cell wall biosynthesis
MRIAFVYDALYPWVKGGAERRFHELGRRLAAAHDVHYLSWQWWEGDATVRRDGMTFHGVGRAPALYGGDGKRTVSEAVAFSARLLPTLLKHRFDVIDCSATPYLPLYPTAFAARMTGARLVATWHEFWGEHWGEYLPHRPVVALTARTLEAGARRLGDRVVVVSGFTARVMDMESDPRVAIVPNGVDVEAIRRAAPPGDASDLLFIGRLIDEKRVDLLLDALAALATRHPSLRCTIIGDGPERSALERRSVALAIDDRLRFLGEVPSEELAGHLRASRILVLPSVREGYGMTVAEGQAAGAVPVVVRAPFSAASDLVRDGVDGILVEPTVESVADGIASLLTDERRLKRMAAAARLAGRSRDWASSAEQAAAVYEELVRTDTVVPERKVRWS